MFSKSVWAIARRSNPYVCLFCVRRTFERSFVLSLPRHDAVTDISSGSSHTTEILLNSDLSSNHTKVGQDNNPQGQLNNCEDGNPNIPSDDQHQLENESHSTKGDVKTIKSSKKAAGTVRRVISSRSVVRRVSVAPFDGTKNPATAKPKSRKRRHDEFASVHAGLSAQSDILEPPKGKITALNTQSTAVPGLAYGLDRVLFNPGVYHLRDPRSRVYNFDPYLSSIMPVSEFDFKALGDYITSSQDVTLRKIAREQGKKYIGSSSSMTSVLSHFHFLLSAWRPLDLKMISRGFSDEMQTFTRLTRAPSAVFLRYKDGVYAIDADKEFDSANVLMNLGKSMEKLLTMPTDEFERYRRMPGEEPVPGEAAPESYHYSTYGDFLMRAQLDAYDPRLPGTGMFDLKTRAVVSVRMDSSNFTRGAGYEIRSRFGDYESFEREYFDMVRSAFLKYSLQVRIGRMDGIFVAFHNVRRIFGFQYVSLPEMDKALHGQEDTTLGDVEFMHSVALWNKILDKVSARFPEQSLRFHFETRTGVLPFMYIFAEPVTEEQIDEIQTRNQEQIERIQKQLLYPELCDTSEEAPAAEVTSPPSEEAQAEKDGEQADSNQAEESAQSVVGMTLHVYHKVNGSHVERPQDLTADDKWEVDYKLTVLPSSRAQVLFQACQRRREKQYKETEGSEADFYRRKLWSISDRGIKWREAQDKLDQENGIVQLGG
ncbi:hypothetical protein LOZ61_004557 [Ophidiomyces ophidiicola]|nr:hypothetical protein LOZ61_004557 [Ophidiomyces ophidiicola]KAI1921679.1 hypothetical protein LOZ60_006075 [Ophidiomyces ophidiicola]KAI2031237.1 hypothetical protein LOZ48_002839 [Ophidiomyces ophidiicola]KAI2067342.1 hypothetical protein LOZ40_003138 [Ophidiomyces ophidiicola]KAI2149406.1 hypothetical protein LOZ27_001103 [Ophidiomyces ophidiicola]